MIKNLAAVLGEARRKKYAIGSFNVYNYETIRGVIEAGREMKMPVIVAFGENYFANMGVGEVFALVNTMAAKADVPVVLHLDHCKSFDHVMQALRAGFTSVMFDGSRLSFEENIEKTAQVTAVAHAMGASVEAELGALALGDFSNEEAARQIYTDPEQAHHFVADTGVDALAVSIGTVHGMYKGVPRVDVDILKQIAAVVDIPLVLHGGSGTPPDTIGECIRNGICKINVNTEISVYTVEKVKALLASGKTPHLSGIALHEVDAVKEVVKKYMLMFRGKDRR